MIAGRILCIVNAIGYIAKIFVIRNFIKDIHWFCNYNNI